MNLHPELVKNLQLYFPNEGEAWLEGLPALLDHFAEVWALDLQDPFENLSFNYVTRAQQNGKDVVLKLGVPRDELRSEMAALKLYAGKGAVRLLASDPERGALLLEHLSPGHMLTQLPEEEATKQMCKVMQRIWHPVPEQHGFPHIADWHQSLQGFPRSGTDFPLDLLNLAERFYQELMDSREAEVVLHGDLHHFNVLQSGEDWLAIDPKGIVGERAYEIGAYLRNPYPTLYASHDAKGLQNLQNQRVNLFAEHLNLSRDRILKWGIYCCVLSAVWGHSETADSWKKELLGAEVLRGLL